MSFIIKKTPKEHEHMKRSWTRQVVSRFGTIGKKYFLRIHCFTLCGVIWSTFPLRFWVWAKLNNVKQLHSLKLFIWVIVTSKNVIEEESLVSTYTKLNFIN